MISQRFYKFFKYLRKIAIISLALYLGVAAFNTGNQTLTILSYFLLILTLSCAMESAILYFLSLILKNK